MSDISKLETLAWLGAGGINAYIAADMWMDTAWSLIPLAFSAFASTMGVVGLRQHGLIGVFVPEIKPSGKWNERIGITTLFTSPALWLLSIGCLFGWPIWIFLAALASTAVFIGAFWWPEEVTPAEGPKAIEKPKSLLEDPWFFMAYCICPKCGVEALHWMRPPRARREDFSDDELLAGWHARYRGLESDFAHSWLTRSTDYLAMVSARDEARRQSAFEKMREKGDVIRICREGTCKHEWPQDIGLKDEEAA